MAHLATELIHVNTPVGARHIPPRVHILLTPLSISREGLSDDLGVLNGDGVHARKVRVALVTKSQELLGLFSISLGHQPLDWDAHGKGLTPVRNGVEGTLSQIGVLVYFTSLLRLVPRIEVGFYEVSRSLVLREGRRKAFGSLLQASGVEGLDGSLEFVE